MIESYRDLKVWQIAMDLAVAVYRWTESFPSAEKYGLTSQMRRSSSSVAANIAEGYGRESTGSYVNFLKTARGSLKELETHAILSTRVGFMKDETLAILLNFAADVGRLLNARIRSLRDSSRSSTAEADKKPVENS